MLENKKKVFITGSTGFVGSHITRLFVESGYEVYALKRKQSNLSFLTDISDRIEWIQGSILDSYLLEDCIKNKDYVVHAAAHVSFHTGQRKKLYQINVEGTSNIVNACLKYPPTKLCYISSIATINKMSEAATASTLNEEAHWDSGEKHSDYANSKYLAEMEVWRAAAEELNIVILNPSTVLGQGYMNQNTGLLFDYVKRENRFYTDGYINYVDVRDVAKACFLLTTDQDLAQQRYIINSGMITYQDFFSKIAHYMGKKAPNIYLPLYLVKTLIPIWNTLQWIFKTKGQIPLQAFSKGQQVFDYSTQKLTDTIDIELKPLEETLQWVSIPNHIST